MNIGKKLQEKFNIYKQSFFTYIENLKKSFPIDFYTISNTTIISNPYNTEFPKQFFLKEYEKNNFFLFIKSSLKFYIKNFIYLNYYFITFIIYKLIYKKQNKTSISLGIDVFLLTNKILQENKFNEQHYLPNLYYILKEKKIDYCIVVRFYELMDKKIDINKIIKFFKILNKSDENFVFEYSVISFSDFIYLFYLILVYPFKTIRLLQKNDTLYNKIFNNSLLKDIETQSFDSFTRYIFGKNIAKKTKIKKIYSWSEFQVIERSFNFGIREYNKTIQLIGIQFYLNYETYFNSIIYDIDDDMKCAFHKVLVNGRYYLKERKKVIYELGVSLRYKNIFSFNISNSKKDDNILIFGTYDYIGTMRMLEGVQDLSNLIFKNHPSVSLNLYDNLLNNIVITDEDVYKLFLKSNVVICTGFSGISVEAVACGLSVIIIANQNNFTANPLVEYGKNKIWSIVYDKKDIKIEYNKLLEYRKNNIDEIEKIANWYKENFFVEPTEINIKKAFNL